MKRLFTLCVLLCAALAANAQDYGKLFWGRRNINLGDYARLTSPLENGSVIYSDIQWQVKEKCLRDGNLFVGHKQYSTYLNLVTSKAYSSAVTPAMLDYQQLMFDIAQLYAERLTRSGLVHMEGMDWKSFHMSSMVDMVDGYELSTSNGTDASAVALARREVLSKLGKERGSRPSVIIPSYEFGFILRGGYAPGFGLDASAGVRIGHSTFTLAQSGSLSSVQYSYDVLDSAWLELSPLVGVGQNSAFGASSVNAGLGLNARCKCIRFFYPATNGFYSDCGIYSRLFVNTDYCPGMEMSSLRLSVNLAVGLDFSLGFRK